MRLSNIFWLTIFTFTVRKSMNLLRMNMSKSYDPSSLIAAVSWPTILTIYSRPWLYKCHEVKIFEALYTNLEILTFVLRSAKTSYGYPN